VLDKGLRSAWRERPVSISPVPRFLSDGLVFGAGTVLLAAEGARRFKNLEGQDARVLTLLCAAYGRPIAPSVLGNIKRAANSWSEGDDCLAYVHLAHAGLAEPEEPYEAARRLFIADALMKAGTKPRTIIEALDFGPHYADAVEKLYNPVQPRVSAGSGRISGQWTRYLSFLGNLPAVSAESLGDFAVGLLARAGGAAEVAFQVLFIPSPNDIRVEGDVPGMPGLRYAWNRDETELHLTYDGSDGAQSTFTAQLEDDVFRDQSGGIVGRILPDGNVAIDLHAFPSIPANDDEPRLCPLPGLDKPGELGRDYEDYVKSVVNPVDTTPRYWGFQLLNLQNCKMAYYDDCQHSTGLMVDAKGPGYTQLLQFPSKVRQEFLDESARQLAALGTRQLRWYFAEFEAAESARALFRAAGGGRERIDIEFLPWSEKTK
jgi:hypothetical protein